MNAKEMGLMTQVARGLLKHGECRTVQELGDRSKYVGLSDIGKGAECLRSAVAGKVFGSQHPKSNDVLNWYRENEFDKVMETLRKQLILQRGHWFESGIETAFKANQAKLFTQLEIDAGVDGVPVLAHLDFVLVGKGAVRVLELKSMAQFPDDLYTAYLTQVYGQLSFLYKYWNKPRFNIRDGTDKKNFPELVKQEFGIDMPDSADQADIEGWVLALSMKDAKAFGPYKPNSTMTRFCEKTAKAIWDKADLVRNKKMSLDKLDYVKGFHALCNYCGHAEACPKFKIHDLNNPVYDDILTELDELKQKKIKLCEKIGLLEEQVRDYYEKSGVDGDWISTGNWKFRASETAGRKTLDTKALTAELINILGEDQVENLLHKFTEKGLPGQRLYINRNKA